MSVYDYIRYLGVLSYYVYCNAKSAFRHFIYKVPYKHHSLSMLWKERNTLKLINLGTIVFFALVVIIGLACTIN